MKQECKNYIDNPKDSGYRGIHDVYIYRSKMGYGRSKKWDGLSVEIQYRTIYQHAWATAVEVADSIYGERAKFSQGNEKQKEFFRLASEIIARAFENRKSCKPELSDKELIYQFVNLENEINLLHRLMQLKAIHRHPDKILEKNVIIIFDANLPEGPRLLVHTYKNLKYANQRYFEMEKKYPNSDIVLVTTNDKKISKSVKNAYRNYFIDTKDFTSYINEGVLILSKNFN